MTRSRFAPTPPLANRAARAVLGIVCLLPACGAVVVEESGSGTGDGGGGAATTGGASSTTATTGTSTTTSTSTTTFGPVCAPSGPSGSIPWGRAFDSQTFATRIAVDSTGSPFVAGGFVGQATIGDVVFGAPGTAAKGVFLAKLDACGEVLWAKSLGALEEPAFLFGMGLGGQDRIAVVTGGVDAATSAIHVLDTVGAELWKKEVHNLLWMNEGVSVTADGGLILGGLGVMGDADLGAGSIPGSEGAQVIARIDAAGEVVWTTIVPWAGNGAMAVSPPGDVYFSQTDAGEPEVGLAVTKIDASGSVLWTWAVSGAGSLWGPALAADEGGVFLAGLYSDVIDLGVGVPDSPGTTAGFLLRLLADGEVAWADVVLPADPSSQVGGLAVALSADGEVQIAGAYKGAVDFAEAGALPFTGAPLPFFARVSKEGALQWKSSPTGMLQEVYPEGAAVGPDGRAWVILSLIGTIQLADGTPVTPEPNAAGRVLVWINP